MNIADMRLVAQVGALKAKGKPISSIIKGYQGTAEKTLVGNELTGYTYGGEPVALGASPLAVGGLAASALLQIPAVKTAVLGAGQSLLNWFTGLSTAGKVATVAGAAAVGYGTYKLLGGGGVDFGMPTVKEWSTGTANFAMLADGRIAVARKNGTIKVYRPYHPPVVGKRLTSSKIHRMSSKLNRLYHDLVVGHTAGKHFKSRRS